MRFKRIISVLFLLCVSLAVESQGEDFHFVLLAGDRNLYLFDGTSANKITDEWVVAFTVTETGILVIEEQNIVEYDLNGQYQSTLADFDERDWQSPIWIDIADIPSSNELIGEFETIGTLEGGVYRFDPNNVLSSLSFIGEGWYSNPDVSSDGRYLVFDKNTQRLTDLDTPFVYSAIALYDLDILKTYNWVNWVYITSELQGSCGGARWHPTQNKIVYTCFTYENAESTRRTYVTDIDSAETEQLPFPGDVWSPDGNAIAYRTESGINIVSLDTMTVEFIAYPPELIDKGVRNIEWLPQ